MRDEEYFAIKDRAAAVLLKIPDVTGVGMGGRERNGQPTGEIVIKVFVRRKKPRGEVPPDEMIPASFEGVPTDVVEMGTPVPLVGVPGAVAPAAMTGDDVPTSPLQGGMAIGIDNGGAATLGCMLRDTEDATAVYGLTNHHVLSNGKFSLSRRVLQPNPIGVFDDPIGYPAAGAEDTSRDVALVRLDPNRDWLPSIKDIGFVRGIHDVTIAEAATQTYQVRKRGRWTKLTGGIVEAIGVRTGSFFRTQRNFNMVIKPNPAPVPPFTPSQQVFFSFLGDSGSAVVNDDNQVVGLLWGGDVDTTQQFAKDVATPIRIVLDRFRQIEKLNLIVATPTSANPTDASEVRGVPFPAGSPRLSVNDMLAKGDHGHHRPLVGGSQILAEPFGFANSGTLGCVVTEVGSPGTAYILTSYAGISASGNRPPTTDTDVGQPDNSDSCSLCCINTVGEFAKGGPADTTPTAAIVKLKDDQKWLAEIMQIGLIDDIAPPLTALDIGSYQVRKRGAGSRLTGGIVTAVGGVGGALPPNVRPDAMIIRPNPNPFRAGQDICFSQSLDRGAIVMNGAHQAVGLLYDEVEIPDGGITVVHGVATPMQVVLDALNNLADIEVVLATATAQDDVRTTTKRVATSLDTSTPPVVPAGAFEWLEAELSQSTTGRLVVAVWSDHRGEIRHLIDHNRKVATAWHRSGGPALVQALSRAFHLPSAILPTTLNGRPIAECLDRLARVLCKYASPSLRADIERLHSMLPPIGGRSLVELLMNLNRG